ncbi:MAG: PEP-CTERM sorting domain-containing protein [Planctomycetales bacterium]|nr:PEP-CTERM sorting domain-containing protein [Planctomycetales bacterium]
MFLRRFTQTMAICLSLVVVGAVNGDLIGYWPLDGNGDDISGNGLNGMPTGDFLFTDDVPDGLSGQSIHINPEGVFPGEEGYVDLGNPDLLNFGDNDWTVSAWMKVNEFGFGVRGNIFSNGGDNGGGVRYVLAYIENGGQAIVLTTDDNTDKRQAQASADDYEVDDEAWHHIVGQREDTELRVYIDGELAGENLDVPDGYDLSGTDQLPAYIGIGADAGSGAFEKSFQGWIDDVAVWNTALTEDQIAAVAKGDFSEWLGGGVAGDFNGSGARDVADLDMLAAAMGGNDATFDLNNDGQVNYDDRVEWVVGLSNTYIGDANFDGQFNSSDFVAVFGAAKYETGQDATWAEGDWNGDGKFNSGDFVAAFAGGGYEGGPRPGGLQTVPEPSSIVLVVCGMICLAARRRR